MNKCIHAHSLSSDEVFGSLGSSERGLTEKIAKERRLEFGENSLPLAPVKPAWKRFLTQFDNVLIYVLICSGLLSITLEHYVDSGVIFGVVVVNAIVGFIQEGKAEDALRAIMSMTKSTCMAIRDGVVETLDSSELVPGDIVVLKAGDRVPADIRLIFIKELRCDESTLTGEAQPVGKLIDIFPVDTPLAERKNMAYMGTMVTFGLARGIVTRTGLKTQIGEISNLVRKVELVKTPLQQQLARFASQLTIGIVVVSLLTMILGILIHNFAFGEMFQAAIGIAVSSIPEGLPAIVTITLAIGVQIMAKNQSLVRRLPAVEVLGSVDVICSDKTGTLTANAMTAREVYTSIGSYQVSGTGYKPEGAIKFNNTSEYVLVDHDSCFTQACVISMLCNEAHIKQDNSSWILHGDPTEGALVVLASKHGLTTQELDREWQRIDVIPFESEKRYMATLHHNVEGKIQLMVKGAPEKLLSYASHQLGSSGITLLVKEPWQQVTEDYARRGMRVMALAMKEYAKRPDALSHLEVENKLVMVGLIGISDPPRSQAKVSIDMCHAAGIKVKMITGDNPITAAAIGNEIGLNAKRVMTGQEIDRLTTEQLEFEVERTDIFSRASPANKLQLVKALQQNRHVVAMTGDGVNDAPALKKANIGVAMGQKGTDAAKDAADFVLTDDNFGTIVKAVREGRTVYDNIVKSIVFILPTNLAEALVIFTAIMFGRLMPITPAQILWVNMITAITLALALAFEKTEVDVMNRPPRPFAQGLFSAALVGRMLMVGAMGASIVFALFYYYRTDGVSIEYARTIAVNALVMIEVFYLFNCRLLTQTIFSRFFLVGCQPMLVASVSVVILQILFSYLPLSQRLFGLESIRFVDWLILVVFAAPVMLVVELEKFFQRKITNVKINVE